MDIAFSYIEGARISSHLICDICAEPFIDPLTSSECGHTFCASCISSWLRQQWLCPTCLQGPLTLVDMQPCHSIILSMLDELLVRCKYSQCGCECKGNRRDWMTHATNCKYIALEHAIDDDFRSIVSPVPSLSLSLSSAPSPIPTSPSSSMFPPSPPPTIPLPALPSERARHQRMRPPSPPSPSPTSNKNGYMRDLSSPKTVRKAARMGRGISNVTLSREEQDIVTPKKAVGIWIKANLSSKREKPSH